MAAAYPNTDPLAARDVRVTSRKRANEGGPVTRAIRAMRVEPEPQPEPAGRRLFLRALAALPMIGGGVTLIGNPSGVAAAPSMQMLAAYNEWLFYERRLLCIEAFGGSSAEAFVPAGSCAHDFHFPLGSSWREAPQPSTRAALVLSAVGCDWRA